MIEFTIALDTKTEKPLYEQIYQYIKEEIKKGRLKINEKLPSTRRLAINLQVSRSTIDLAYEQLASEGYIYAVPCKGYFVSQIENLYDLKKEQSDITIDIQPEEITYAYDFSPNGIDLDAFPYNVWRKISKNTLLDDNKDLYKLGSPNGELSLRITIADYLHQARGVECLPEQIIVGAGNDYLLMLLDIILGREYNIAMENPTYTHAYKTFLNLKHTVNLIDVDKNGMDVSKLKNTDSDIAYVMPSHQFPLGIVMPIKRRIELLNWANMSEKRYIIEDDYDSEFRYKGKPIPALLGIDNNGKVIYIGTFSKSIAPAMRISYMVLPKKLMQEYYDNQGFYASTISKIDQKNIDSFITEGYYERHLNKMRGIYKNKHDVLINELKCFEGKCIITGENAGVHILLNFSKKISEKQLIESAQKEGVKVYGISEYFLEKSQYNEGLYTTILIGYASLNVDEIIIAVKKLEKAWKDILL